MEGKKIRRIIKKIPHTLINVLLLLILILFKILFEGFAGTFSIGLLQITGILLIYGLVSDGLYYTIKGRNKNIAWAIRIIFVISEILFILAVFLILSIISQLE